MDVMVRPAVADIPILAFNRYAEVVRAGHEGWAAGDTRVEGGEPRRVAHPGRRDVAPEQRGRGGGGGGLGGMTLREVGSKGRLASVAPGGGCRHRREASEHGDARQRGRAPRRVVVVRRWDGRELQRGPRRSRLRLGDGGGDGAGPVRRRKIGFGDG